MQTRFSIISNLIFKYFLIFAISFLWLNFYNQDLLVVALISTIITIITGYTITIISRKRTNISNLTIKETEKMKEISFNLLMADKNNILIFFNILLNINHSAQIVKTKDIITFDNTAFVPFYKKHKLTEDDLIEIYKNYKYEKLIVSCVEYSEETYLLSQKIASTKIHLLDEQSLFSIFKKYDLYPDFKITTIPKNRFKYKNLKSITFTKNNSKHYLFSGIIILITSFFIKYNIYYIIFATLLFIFSAISFFKPQHKQPDIIDEI